MMIIEGLKELKLIESKMKKNNEQIEKYSSILDNERPQFESESHQMQEVKNLVQSNKDLQERYLRLKAAIDRTNLSTKVKIDGQTKEYTIYELIIIKRKLGDLIKQTYTSMNTKQANGRLSITRSSLGGPSNSAKVVQLYDERVKNEALDAHENFMSVIDRRLEVVNAVTAIIE